MDTVIFLLITMAFSAFFSGMEIAFVSVDKLRFEMERKSGVTSSIISYFLRNPNNFISTMLVGNNIALVIYGILMAQIIEVNLLAGIISNHFVMVLVQTVISTLIILVTGEFLPKTLFKINPNLMLRVCAIPLFICYVILFPVSKFASGLSYLFLRIFGMKVNKEASAKAFGKVDLDYFIQSSIENAESEEELDAEVKIFQNALDFSNIKIRDCIVPRTEVVAVDLTTTLEELKCLFVESGISKIIVYDGNIDNVVGYIHSSEMFRNPVDWKNNVKEVPIVPETMSAHKLMKLFMQQKKTIAVVVDEFGGTAGIVSLEDLVEEIFGDIEDEHDSSNRNTNISQQLFDKNYKKYTLTDIVDKKTYVDSYGDEIKENYYVFINSIGKPINISTWNKTLREIFEKSGLSTDNHKKEHNLSHRFRHGFAMFLVQYKNIRLEELKLLMRHESLSSTAIYYRPTEDDVATIKEDFSKTLEELIPMITD